VTLFAGDEYEGEWSGYCYPGCPDDVCRAEGCCAWQPPDEAPPGRRVVSIETTGDPAVTCPMELCPRWGGDGRVCDCALAERMADAEIELRRCEADGEWAEDPA
jgi:hypothetical protein